MKKQRIQQNIKFWLGIWVKNVRNKVNVDWTQEATEVMQ